MRRVLPLAMLLVALAWVRGGPAYACSCTVVSPKTYLARSAVAFVGVAVAVTEASGGLLAAFEVERVFKGSPQRSVSVTTSSDCAVPFASGVRYLVFANDDRGRLSTGLCDGTSEDATALDKAGVRPLPATQPPSQSPRASGETGGKSEPSGGSRTAPILLAIASATGVAAAIRRFRPS